MAQLVKPEQLEWIVVNDGIDPTIPKLLNHGKHDFQIVHVALAHPATGFGLCHARNLGLEAASGTWVAYLDDDNQLAPEYVATALDFVEKHPAVSFAMVQQRRRRDHQSGKGVPFISPSANCTAEALIRQDALFDSNGFIHRREDAPRWNSDYRIFCDYEYFLRCASIWGIRAFALCSEVFVDYVQSSNGIIGQSGYGDWSQELTQICDDISEYPVIQPYQGVLRERAARWYRKRRQSIPAFSAQASNQSSNR